MNNTSINDLCNRFNVPLKVNEHTCRIYLTNSFNKKFGTDNYI